VSGITKDSKKQGDDYREVPYLRVANVQRLQLNLSEVKTIPAKESTIASYRLEPGDILLNEGGDRDKLGRGWIWQGQISECIHQNHVFRARIRDGKAIPKWIAYYANTNEARAYFLESGKQTTNLASISKKNLSALPVPLPPFHVQEILVAEIDTHLSRLDEVVTTLQGIQAKLKQARASILKAAVEGRLVETEAEPDADQAFHEIAEILNKRKNLRRPKWKTPLQASKLTIKSHVPAHWQAATIDQLCDVGTGATPRKSDIKHWKNGHIPWITSSVCNARFVDAASDLVTDDALRETNLSLYPSGTILIAMYGEGKTRGQHTMLRIEATTNQAMAALSTSCLEDPTVRWFRIFLDSNYLEMRRKSSGGVQPNLNLSIVKSIALPFPPIAEQVEIADEVDRRFSVLDQVEATVHTSLARCGLLRQAILKRAFEGRLVPSA
jgi:type I restriction enzyme S subunit